MSKWVIFAGFIVAGILLYQFNVERITTVDVVKFLAENAQTVPASGGQKADQKSVVQSKNNTGNIKGTDGNTKVVSNKKNKKQIKEPEDRNLTILAFGDIMLGRYVRVMMDENGADYIFNGINSPEKFLQGAGYENGADVIFGNLEGPINGQGKKGGTSLVFSFNEDIAPLLKNFGFTLLSISNNHALDQGWKGRDTTISALENNELGWCGHPTDADPSSVYYSLVGQEKFAFVCFQDVTHKLDDEAAVELIKAIRPSVDYLIVSIHWGIEYKHKPDSKSQIEPGHAFIDAGADFVIGHHPHVVQSFEIYNGKVIFYSLGNFIFDQYWSKDTQEGLAIGIELDDTDGDGGGWFGDYGDPFRTKINLFPIKIDKSQPRLMTEDERGKWIEIFIGYGNYDDEIKEQIRNGVIEIPQ